MSSAFGKTWWGQQWLQALNNIDYSNRLPRGSSYAKKGSVTKININENSIHAKVAGSRPKPYNVDIILPPFFEPELGNFIEALALRPVIISKLLNRQLDPEVLTIAENMGLKVFPKQWTDFKMQCSCPDWAVPCKHLAAVIYKVSSEIDNNPFLVFNLHRVDLIQELNKRGIQISAEQNDIPLITDLLSEKRLKKDIPTAANYEDAYRKISFSELSDIHEPLLALLSGGPVFYTGNGDFKEKYITVLSRIIKNVRKIIQGKINLNDVIDPKEKMPEINTHSQASLYINETSVSKVLTDGKSTSLPAFLARIFEIPSNKTLDYQPSIAALHTACHMALHLIASGSVVPQIVCLGDKNYTIRWLPAMISSDVRKIVGQLEEILPAKIMQLEIKEKQKDVTYAPAIQLLSAIITELIQFLSDKTNEDLFLYLFFERFNYPFLKPGEQELCGGMQMWLQKYFLSQGNFKPQIMVEESLNDEFLISVNILGKNEAYEQGVKLSDVLNLTQYNKDRFEILKSLAHLSDFVPGLDNYINSKGTDLILMNYTTFTPFLMGMIPVIKLLDIDILLPKALHDILKPKPSIKLSAKKSKL